MPSQAQTFQINTILMNEIIGTLRLVWFMVLNANFNNISVDSSYIVAVSFIAGRNRSIRKKPPTCCRKSLANFIT
jgi:hypothetical protein